MKRPVSFSIRLLALIADLSLAFGVYHVLYSFPSFRIMERTLTGHLEFLKGGLSSYFSSFLLVYIICQCMRFYGTLLFGLSFGQLVCGIFSYGTALRKRLSGASRVVLDTFTMPLLIFDIPILLGKRSYSEGLTSNFLFLRPGKPFFILRMILIPALFFLTLFSPLLQNLELIDGLVISFSKQKEIKLNNEVDFSSFSLYPSNRFHFKAFSDLKKGRLILLPNFEISKKNNKKAISPFLTVYDRKKENYGHFRIHKKINLITLIKKGRLHNPLFSVFYPELSKVLEDDKNKFEFKKSVIKELSSLFSPPVIKDIVSFVKSSFQLNFSNMPSHMMKHGPFISGYVNIRNSFLRPLKKGAIPKVDILNLGNGPSKHPFLRFRQVFTDESSLEKKNIDTMIPLGSPHSFIFEFIWNSRDEREDMGSLFVSSFLNTAEWAFDYEDIFTFPHSRSDLTPLHIMDWLIKGNLQKGEREKLMSYIYGFYNDIAKISLERADDLLRSQMTQGLKRVIVIAKIRNNKTPSYFSRESMQNLQELLKALESNNSSYFNT